MPDFELVTLEDLEILVSPDFPLEPDKYLSANDNISLLSTGSSSALTLILSLSPRIAQFISLRFVTIFSIKTFSEKANAASILSCNSSSFLTI